MLAIHHTEGSFSDYWVEYCEKNKVPYKLVDCYRSDIVQQLGECSALMWHWHHHDARAILFAKQLIYSVETMGKLVFPSVKTCWHFDDKVAQKYLLEAIGAPLVPSHVFYDRHEALDWIEGSNFPKVFKLRGGAGAQNVSLVKDRATAKGVVRKAFSMGFRTQNIVSVAADRIRVDKSFWPLLKLVLKAPDKLVSLVKNEILRSREKGYVYFQDFIPNNDHDVRVIVIGDKAFAIKRMCRDGDFRASGSGRIIYEHTSIDERCVKLSFEVAECLDSQSTAFDFVFDLQGNPLIVEISYCFTVDAYKSCQGYWAKNLNWIEEDVEPRKFMIEDVLTKMCIF